jgi:hypothetical protein
MNLNPTNTLLFRYFIRGNKEAVMRAKDSEVVESVFDRNKRRESEINAVLKQESARHDAAVKNMQRLRALRIERDAKTPTLDRVKKRA